MSEQKRVVLVDTNAFIHAAWHGYPERLGEDGKCYRVIHGMISKLHRLERDFQWDMMVAVLDPEEGSLYRKALFPGYKAHRPEEDIDFSRQKSLAESALRDFGVNVWREAGVESDDLLGTLARKEAEAGSLVMIVSPDKDLAQMVNPSIGLLRPNKGEMSIQTPFDYLDAHGVKAKYGVWPHQVADWLALLGDASDNIPGVDKVGPKTAAKWLEAYGDLETLMACSHEIKGAAGQNLREAREILPLLKKLTTIQTELEIDPASYLNGKADDERRTSAQRRFGMAPWMGHFGLLDPQDEPAQAPAQGSSYHPF